MKKLITLLIAAGSFVTVQAQTSKEDARKVVLGEPKNGGSTPSRNGRDVVLGGDNGTNSRNYPNSKNYPNGSTQAEQVNREYDAKINSIRNNVYLSQSEKERMIAQLEKDRSKRLREINTQYNKKGKKYKNGDNDDRTDNGKHKGWKKGKGNQGKDKHDD